LEKELNGPMGRLAAIMLACGRQARPAKVSISFCRLCAPA
jgi:hypothetical protein